MGLVWDRRKTSNRVAPEAFFNLSGGKFGFLATRPTPKCTESSPLFAKIASFAALKKSLKT